jgi:hypothetical protein
MCVMLVSNHNNVAVLWVTGPSGFRAIALTAEGSSSAFLDPEPRI